MFINIITTTVTISLGTLAMQTVSQEQCGAFASLVSAGSSCLAQNMPKAVTAATGI